MSPRRRCHAILAVALAVILMLAGSASAQPEVLPGLGIRLLEVAQGDATDPRANVYVTDHVAPGTTVERRIEVSNGTEQPLPVTLYGVASSVSDGWVVQDGRGGNDLADWITVEPASVVLDPGARAEVLARIEVPATAGGGERYATIVAASQAEGEGAVTVISRAGIRVYLSVGGDVAPVEDFRIDTLTGGRDDEGTPFVLIGVTNTGERAVDVSGSLRLTDGPGQLSAGPFDVSLPRTIGPGDTGQLQVPMDAALPAGPWLATADLASGLLQRQAQATITFPSAGVISDPVAAQPVVAPADAGPPPGWVLAIGGLLLVALLILALLLWRRRKKSDDEEEDQDVQVDGPGEPSPGAAEPVSVGVGPAVPGAVPAPPDRDTSAPRTWSAAPPPPPPPDGGRPPAS